VVELLLGSISQTSRLMHVL